VATTCQSLSNASSRGRSAWLILSLQFIRDTFSEVEDGQCGEILRGALAWWLARFRDLELYV
jgi:hypothetical protein